MILSPNHFSAGKSAIDRRGVFVRNSIDAAKVTAHFTDEEWSVFLRGVKVGEFDLPKVSNERTLNTTKEVHAWREVHNA